MTTDEGADERGLDAVVNAARREREDPWADPRWEQLADGTISAADRAALEALATRSPAHAEAMAAFAPLSSSFKAELTSRVLVGGGANGHNGATVVSMVGRRSRALRWLSICAPLVAAAAAVAILWSPSARLPPLPSYALQLSAGAQDLRGAAAPERISVFYPDTTFELIARPEAPATGPVAAAGVLVGNGVRVRWTPTLDRSDEGVLRVRGPAREVLPVGPGEWTVMLAVGRAEEVERLARALELSDAVGTDPAVLSVRLRVAPSRP